MTVHEAVEGINELFDVQRTLESARAELADQTRALPGAAQEAEQAIDFQAHIFSTLNAELAKVLKQYSDLLNVLLSHSGN